MMFLTEHDVKKQLTVLANYLSIGQFELARAHISQLHRHTPQKAVNILTSIITRGPPKDWLCSISVPSTAHLSWLCLCELRALSPADADNIPPLVIQRLEFDVMLTSAILDSAVLRQACLSAESASSLRYFYMATLCVHHDTSPLCKVPSIQLLPAPNFMPPLLSALPECFLYRAQEMNKLRNGDLNLPESVLHELKVLFRSQPVNGFAISRKLCEVSSKTAGSTVNRLQKIYTEIIAELILQERPEVACRFLHQLSSSPLFSILHNISIESYYPEAPHFIEETVRKTLRHIMGSPAPVVAMADTDRIRTEERSEEPFHANRFFNKFMSTFASRNKRPSKLSTDASVPYTKESIHEPVPDTREDGPVRLHKYKIYESLLHTDDRTALVEYLKMEDAHLLVDLERSVIPPAFEALHLHLRPVNDDSAMNPSMIRGSALHKFWSEYFTMIRVLDDHCVEFVMRKALTFISRKRFEEAAKLAEPFPPLKPLMILLSWDGFDNDITSRQHLMDALWMAEQVSGSVLKEVLYSVERLQYLLQLTWWYARKQAALKSVKPPRESIEEIANRQLDEFSKHSFLFVMQSLLAKIDPAEMLSFLSDKLPYNPDAKLEHDHDVMLLRCYYSLRLALRLFHLQSKGSIDAADIERAAEEIEGHLSAIGSTVIQVSLMQMLFALLFVRRSHLKSLRSVPSAASPTDLGTHPNSFLATAALISPLLLVLANALHRLLTPSTHFELHSTEESTLDANQFSSTDTDLDSDTIQKAPQLLRYVREALWRLHITSSTRPSLLSGDSMPPFMGRMLSSPDTLLHVCLKRSSYPQAKHIISFFKLSPHKLIEVLLAEKLDSLKLAMEYNGEMSVTQETVEELLQLYRQARKSSDEDTWTADSASSQIEEEWMTLDVNLNGFYICIDLAITAAQRPEQCSDMLDKAMLFLGRCKNGSGSQSSSSSAASVGSRLFDFFTGHLDRLRLLVEAPKRLHQEQHHSLRNVLTNIQTMPTEPAQLRSHLSRLQNRRQALSSLMGSVMGLKREGKSDSLDHFLRSAIQSLSTPENIKSTDNDSVRGELQLILEESETASLSQLRSPLISAEPIHKELGQPFLLSFLQYVADVGDNIRSAKAKDTEQTNFDYFSVLSKHPKDILAELIFELGGEQQAQYLSAVMSTDIVDVIVNSSQRLTDTINETVEQKRFPLSMRVVRYLGQLESTRMLFPELEAPLAPWLSTLACIERRGNSPFSCQFISYALQQAAPFPFLHRWIDARTDLYSKFLHIFLGWKDETVENETASEEGQAKSQHRPSNRLPSDLIHLEPLTPMQQRAFDCIHSEGQISVDMFHELALEKLLEEHRLEQGLQLIHESIQVGGPHVESLLQQLIDKPTDKSHVWRHLLRLKDKTVAAGFILRYLEAWDVDTALDMLNMCRCHLTSESALLSQVVQKQTLLETFRLVFRVVPDRWNRWQELQAACESDAKTVVRILIDRCEHALARKIMEHYGAIELRLELEEDELFHLLTTKNDKATAFQRLMAMADSQALGLSVSLLPKIDHISTKSMLIQFVLGHTKALLTESDVLSLSVQKLSLSVLSRLPASLRDRFVHLLNHPSLIIESLLMDRFVDIVARLFGEFPKLQDDSIVIRYAEKAMSLHNDLVLSHSYNADDMLSRATSRRTSDHLSVTSSLPSTPKRKPFPRETVESPLRSPPGQDLKAEHSKFWCLTGDFRIDEEVRSSHTYDEAPSIDLCEQLLDLVIDSDAAAEACFNLCDSLSRTMSSPRPGATVSTQLLVQLIRKLLDYVKNRASKAPQTAQRFLSKCTSYADYTDLLQRLLLARCGSGVSLTHLAQPEHARVIRDKLVSEDRMQLAVELSDRCNVSSDTVWSHWGLAQLRIGSYEEARVKLKASLAASHERRVQGTVKKIVEELETKSITSIRELRDSHHELSMRQLYISCYGRAPTEDQLRPRLNRYSEGDNGRPHEGHRQRVSKSSSPSSGKFHSSASAIALDKYGASSSLSSMDSVRMDQSIHYLKNYGTPNALIHFYMQHSLLERACRFIFAENIATDIFVEEVVQHCLFHGNLNQLQQALNHIDPTLRLFQDYLTAACRYLYSVKAFDYLYRLHLFMKDFNKAGYISITLFTHASDFDSRMGHLQNARNHFSEALTQLRNDSVNGSIAPTTVVNVNETEISRELRKVKLQLELTQLFPESSDMNIFQTPADVVVNLLPDQVELANRVLVLMKLNLRDMYTRAASIHAARGDSIRLESLLAAMEFQKISSREWDLILLHGFIKPLMDVGNRSHAEVFIPKLYEDRSRLLGYRFCGDLEGALLIAVRLRSGKEVALIRSEADRLGLRDLVQSCDQFLPSTSTSMQK